MPILQPSDPNVSNVRALRGIHVYYYFMSNCAQRVTLALAEKGLDWTPHSVNLSTKENTQPEYLRINPIGLVPAMVHDGVVITESMDILRYIEEHFPEPSLYPADQSQRQVVDEWMNLATEKHVSVVKKYMYAMAFGKSKSPEELARYLEHQKDQELSDFHTEASDGFSDDQILEAERAIFAFYDKLEQALGEHLWVVGDEYSYADIAWFVQYFLMKRTGVVNFANYPNVQNWAEMFMARPSFKIGVANLQPWYEPVACLVLKIKSFMKRGGFAPKEPRQRSS